MSEGLVERIANAVLYEGYMLYPYRPSAVKNRQRFNFGVVYPRSYAEKQSGSDVWFTQTECIANALQDDAAISARLRFLQMTERTVEQVCSSSILSGTTQPRFEPVHELVLGAKKVQSWQEATERELSVAGLKIKDLCSIGINKRLELTSGENREFLLDEREQIAGAIVRKKANIDAELSVRACRLADGIYKLQVRITNLTAADSAAERGENVLMHSLLSAHAILNISGGEFVSQLEPPEDFKEFTESCKNSRAWPVLAGKEGQRDTMLALPIILYDYPEIAPQSPGDLFDGTEIDEILSLRILTLTDAEKQEMCEADDRTREILTRTEGLSVDDLLRMHGTLKRLRSLHEEGL